MLKLISAFAFATVLSYASTTLYISWDTTVPGTPTFNGSGIVTFTGTTSSGQSLTLLCDDFANSMATTVGVNVPLIFDYSTLNADQPPVYGTSSDPLLFDAQGSNFIGGPQDSYTQYEVAGYLAYRVLRER